MRQWLLLLLRILAIALIVSAFARPTYHSGSPWGGRVVPAAAAVLVDQSYSTAFRMPSGTLADQQRRAVTQLAEVFTERDRVALIPFATTPVEGLSVSPDELRQFAAELTPSQEATNLAGALRQAGTHLAQYPELDGELYLFTDGARHGWSEVPAARDFIGEARVYLNMPEGIERNNAYVKNILFSPWMASSKSEMVLYADVRNAGDAPLRNHSVDLFVDGERVRRRSIDLDPKGETQVELRFTPRRSGRISGFVELAEDDLPIDNRRYFAFDAPAAISVLILGTQPTSTYYARRALGAAALTDPTLSIRSGQIADLSADALQSVDLLLLCDLQRLDRAQTIALRDFVSGGGGLVAFPAAAADLKYLNRDFLPGMLPVRMGDIIGDAGDKAQFHVFDTEAYAHPLFANLLTQEGADVAHFFAHFSLKAESHLNALAYFDDGQIALASGWRGRGRAVWAAFPLDMRWNDLPLHGLFAPMLHRLVREFSQRPGHYAAYDVGASAHRYLSDVSLEAALSAQSPDGEVLRLQPTLVGERYVWAVPALREAGIWQLKEDDRLVDSFPVNIDPRESDLSTVEPAEVERVFGTDIHVMQQGDELRLQVLGNRYGRELWREFVALALVLLLVELWLGRAPRGAVPAAQAA